MNAKVKNVEKEYKVELCEVTEYFVQHEDSNHLNAQDVIHCLLEQAKNLSRVGRALHMDGGDGYLVNDEILCNLFWDIETKLELMDKQLSKAFLYDNHSIE